MSKTSNKNPKFTNSKTDPGAETVDKHKVQTAQQGATDDSYDEFIKRWAKTVQKELLDPAKAKKD